MRAVVWRERRSSSMSMTRLETADPLISSAHVEGDPGHAAA